MPHVAVPHRRPASVHPPEFSCIRSWSAGATRVTVAGELDVATAPRLEDVLRLAEADSDAVVVDLRRVEFIDAAGARVLLTADRRRRRAGGRLLVLRGNAMVDWFFDLVGVGDLLEFVDRPPTGAVDATPRAVPMAREPRHPDAAPTPLVTAARRLEATTAERDELRTRVSALEQELLDLVYQPPSVGVLAAREARPA